jgi:uncharacterized protein
MIMLQQLKRTLKSLLMPPIDPSTLIIQTGTTKQDNLVASAIRPTWILTGNPVARSGTIAKASDNLLSCNVWDCTAGKFQWIYHCDEIVHILEGEVTVTEPDKTHDLRVGDVAFFPAGKVTVWEVPSYVKKFAIHRCRGRGLRALIKSKLGF